MNNSNMTDILEQYIKSLFNEAAEDHIIIKRSNVAQKFDCVPSQLNLSLIHISEPTRPY